jgi:microcystin-dependent protein
MADVSSNLYSWSTTASSNNPSGATNVGSGLDDNLRQLQATVREGLSHYNSVAVASAGTVDLGAQTGNFLIISGTTTITAFGTVSAGIWKVVRFSGALTLTHNGTSLILPGAANITTAAGDVGYFVSEGSGNWRCLCWEPASGVGWVGAAALGAGINALTEDSDPNYAADFFVSYDASATTAKKVGLDILLPPGLVAPYAGTTAPTGWLLCYGQTVSQATYAALYAILGTTYGSDAGGNFTLPDLRGRVVAGQDDMGGSSANRLTDQSGGLNGDTLGDTGGAETHTLTNAELPASSISSGNYDPGGTNGRFTKVSSVDGSGNATGGSGSAHNNVQPTIILNYIIKV